MKILCRRGSEEIVGATIVAEHAGEMLAELTLAVQHRLGISQIAATLVHRSRCNSRWLA